MSINIVKNIGAPMVVRPKNPNKNPIKPTLVIPTRNFKVVSNRNRMSNTIPRTLTTSDNGSTMISNRTMTRWPMGPISISSNSFNVSNRSCIVRVDGDDDDAAASIPHHMGSSGVRSEAIDDVDGATLSLLLDWVWK